MTSSILAPPYQQPSIMHSYGHPPHPPPPGRFIGSSAPRYGGVTHSQNSAQSAANPDEDWTKISDLAERRRIQNRIAQRNYRERKKLKRRLEDLERRASSTSPPPGSGPLPSQHDVKRRNSKTGSMPPKRSPNPNTGAFGSPTPNEYLYARRDSRQPSITPPPSLAYSTGSATTSPSMPSVFQQQGPPPSQPSPYAPYSAPYSESGYTQPILPPPAGLGLRQLPSAHEPWQQPKPAYGEDDMFNHFGMNSQYPASSTAAPYESGVGVSTGYPEQSIYSNQPLGGY